MFGRGAVTRVWVEPYSRAPDGACRYCCCMELSIVQEKSAERCASGACLSSLTSHQPMGQQELVPLLAFLLTTTARLERRLSSFSTINPVSHSHVVRHLFRHSFDDY